MGGYAAALRILTLPDFPEALESVLGAHRGSEQGWKEKLLHLFTECSLGKTYTGSNSGYHPQR